MGAHQRRHLHLQGEYVALIRSVATGDGCPSTGVTVAESTRYWASSSAQDGHTPTGQSAGGPLVGSSDGLGPGLLEGVVSGSLDVRP